MTPEQIKAGLTKLLDRHKRELASCERMIALLQPEWDLFDARAGHDVYVVRDYADHLSAARTHRKKIELFEAAIHAILKEQANGE